jgi:predicted ATPase/class 3 adenylate cyclase
VAVCSHCGRQNADDARFCSGCAAPLVAEPVAPRTVRKTVTVLFCDMVDSTPLGERLDPESLRRVQVRWHESMRMALERHGGTVEKFVGDAVMAVFGLPVAHEDDALRAARAAADMRVALGAINVDLERDYGVEIKVRTALHTGNVVAGAGETLVTGDAVNVAARLEQNAKAGEILLGDQTALLLGEAALMEPVSELTLKGKAQPVSAWRLISVLPDVPAFTRPITTPFVGRGGELASLKASFERAVAASRCELMTVLGAPGIGKSRLLREAVSSLGGPARVVVGRCLPYGEGITYWPLVEIVKQVAGQKPRAWIAKLLGGDENAGFVADTVAAAVGASDRGGSTDQTHWAIRTLLEELARERPLVVVLEDLHWAEPRFLDLVEYLAGFSRERPILLLVSARPELLETRPTWARLGENAGLLVLEALAEPDVEILVEALLAERALPNSTRVHVLEAAEGNPLFVEQLLALQAETTGAEGELAVPPTLRALLAARIDRLDPVDRAVIERAAVEGRGFHRGAVTELLPSGERPDVGARLLALVRKELIRPDRSDFSGDDGFRFAHMLIRDAAYDSTPKELRSGLHERYADWLEAKAAERVREYEEILGFHLEQACRYRRELTPLDEQAAALGRRAAARLASAGRRAFGRGDVRAVVALLRRALSLLPEGDGDRLRLMADLGEALADCGDWEGAIPLIEQAVELAEAVGDRRTRSHVVLCQAMVRLQSDPRFTATDRLDEAKEALQVFQELGDKAGQGRAWSIMAAHHSFLGHFAKAIEANERALACATAAGDERVEADARAHIGTCLLYGASPLDEYVSYTESLLAPANRARGLHMLLGRALAMQGEFDRARNAIADRVALQEELGNVFVATRSGASLLGAVEMLAGHPLAAEQQLRRAYAVLDEAGETGIRSTVAAELADALYAQGRFEEAQRYTRVSEETAAQDDHASQILWRTVRAKAFAREGRLADGEELTREAVTLAEATDNINLRGDALMAFAEVHVLAERPREAVPVIKQALRLYEQKGNLVSADKARALLGELHPSES